MGASGECTYETHTHTQEQQMASGTKIRPGRINIKALHSALVVKSLFYTQNWGEMQGQELSSPSGRLI